MPTLIKNETRSFRELLMQLIALFGLLAILASCGSNSGGGADAGPGQNKSELTQDLLPFAENAWCRASTNPQGHFS